MTTVKQNGDAGTKVALTFDKETAAFTGKLANYTHLKQYNDGGFTVTLSDLPAGATAQLKSIDGTKGIHETEKFAVEALGL